MHAIRTLLLLSLISLPLSAQQALEPGFEAIFDGQSLTGWEGDPAYWSVADGALVGIVTPETVLERNTFIIWRGGEVADFDLRLEYRITDSGNSGINYRSIEVPDLPLAMRGYQADIDGGNRSCKRCLWRLSRNSDRSRERSTSRRNGVAKRWGSGWLLNV
jgi:hypothetical protein